MMTTCPMRTVYLIVICRLLKNSSTLFLSARAEMS
jgi:hypothetical protein